jgi:two-component system, OmpR family, KDP operon response regulator KdpE
MEQRWKVLVVEDDRGICHSLIETLSLLGFVVGDAATGEDALVRLRMVDYDAILLDINMPGMGGMKTCRRISAIPTRMNSHITSNLTG